MSLIPFPPVAVAPPDLITACAYCAAWRPTPFASWQPGPYPVGQVTHGICPECYAQQKATLRALTRPSIASPAVITA